MIKPIPKEKNSIYHDSFYRNKKRTSSIKWWVLFTCLFALALLYLKPSYASQTTQQNKANFLDDIGTGQMLFKSINQTEPNLNNKTNKFQSAVLINSSAQIEINGLIANVTLTQSFINQSDDSVNGIYAFPLPENSAVNHLHIQIADRVIEGKIMEKAQALKVFTQAKNSGKKASLVQQARPNLFTNHIANIAAHEQVTVTIKYFQHVDYLDGSFNLRFPMKITPRYQAQQANSTNSTNIENNKQDESDVKIFTGANSQYSQIFNNQLGNQLDNQLDNTLSNESNRQASNKIQLTVKLNAGVELRNIISSSHQLQISNSDHQKVVKKPFTKQETLVISVGNVQVAMDKDFILQWQPSPSVEPQLSLFKQTLDGETYSLAMLLPPIYTPTSALGHSMVESNSDDYFSKSLSSHSVKEANITQRFARDITFIIDTSGSMQGQPIKQAKQSLRFALSTLSERDSFNIIAFESRYQQAFHSTVMANPQNKKFAQQFIENLKANGGTEMHQPLAKALTMPTTSGQVPTAIKQIIFITDGAVSNELALFKLIHETPQIPRLFTVGIGSAPNGYFMRKAAQFGRGSYTYISNVNEVNTKISALLEKISKPALRNISVLFQPIHLGSIEQYPKKIPDLYFNEPLIIAFKTALMPKSMQLFGEKATAGWHQEVSLTAQQESLGITPIWARAKIEDLLDGLVTGKPVQQVRELVLATSLKHQVISPYSSFIAVEKKEVIQSTKDAHVSHKNKQATPFPKTALGWQVPFFSGLMLLITSLIMQARRSIRFNKNSTTVKNDN